MKFWNKIDNADGTVTITMRGRVCGVQPSLLSPENDRLEFITPKDLDEALASCGDKKKVRLEISSQGGDAYAGIAICNKLKSLKCETEGVVMGIAASAASIILCGCKSRKAYKGSQIMIHGAKMTTTSAMDVSTVKRMARTMECMNESMASVYAQCTGKSKEQCLKLMREETWMTAEQAKDFGIIDEIIDGDSGISINAEADNANIFYGSAAETNDNNQIKNMDIESIIASIGLEPGATDEQVQARLSELAESGHKLEETQAVLAQKEEVIARLTDEQKAAKENAATAAVQAAVNAGKVAPQDTKTIAYLKDAYLQNPEGTQSFIDAMAKLPGMDKSDIKRDEPPADNIVASNPFEAIVAENQRELDSNN